MLVSKQRIVSPCLYGIMLVSLVLLPSLSSIRAEEISSPPATSPKSGLLILSHGSPSPKWNEEVNGLVEKIRQINNEQKIFKAVEGAFLEFEQPDARAGIEKLEAAGCERIVVVPAFIFPTSHSHFDVPAVLGIYTSPSVRATLREEQARIAMPHVPVVVTQTLSESDLLDRYVSDATAAISQKPQNESLLVIAHGDAAHEGLISPTMKRITDKAARNSNLSDSSWCYCGMGQQYEEDVTPALKKLSENGKTVLIVGVYLASSAKDIHNTVRGSLGGPHPGSPNEVQETVGPETRFTGMNLVLSDRSVLEHESAASTVFEIAVSANENFEGNGDLE